MTSDLRTTPAGSRRTLLTIAGLGILVHRSPGHLSGLFGSGAEERESESLSRGQPRSPSNNNVWEGAYRRRLTRRVAPRVHCTRHT